MLPQIVSGEPATPNAVKNKIEILVQTAGAAVIIYDADGWRGELCSCSISVLCVGEKPSAAAASCTWQTGFVWVAAVPHCWVLPRCKVSVLEGQKQSIEEHTSIGKSIACWC